MVGSSSRLRMSQRMPCMMLLVSYSSIDESKIEDILEVNSLRSFRAFRPGRLERSVRSCLSFTPTFCSYVLLVSDYLSVLTVK